MSKDVFWNNMSKDVCLCECVCVQLLIVMAVIYGL